jgi:hypothetical protein
MNLLQKSSNASFYLFYFYFGEKNPMTDRDYGNTVLATFFECILYCYLCCWGSFDYVIYVSESHTAYVGWTLRYQNYVLANLLSSTTCSEIPKIKHEPSQEYLNNHMDNHEWHEAEII